jgi:hypothetical protein
MGMLEQVRTGLMDQPIGVPLLIVLAHFRISSIRHLASRDQDNI